jgi:hypothetical protein
MRSELEAEEEEAREEREAKSTLPQHDVHVQRVEGLEG